MLIGPARITESIILAAIIVCITLVAARLDTRHEAMQTCLAKFSRDTCHSALNR